MFLQATHALRIRAGIILLAFAGAALACTQQAEEGVSVDIAIGMHEPARAGSRAGDQVLGIAPLVGLLPFTHEDITGIRIDIRETATDQYLYTNVWLEQSAGNWIGSIPHLPADTELDFIARAYDVESTEIFNGNTLRTFASGATQETVTVSLAPANNEETYDMPRIAAIQYPTAFASRQEDIVTISIEGQGGATIAYEITQVDGSAAPFYPASGQITLAGTAGQFVSTYKAPEVEETTELTYQVTITGDGNTRVKTNFTTTVKPPDAFDGARDTRIAVLYNPVINAMTSTRPPGTTNVIWEAQVSDDGAPADLIYLWSFIPGETFDPAPLFTDSGTTNPVTLQNYAMAVHGTIRLDVTDANGGVTTLYYQLNRNQFPDQPVRPGLPTGLRSIQAGLDHTCVLFNDGAVHCWGHADKGQLGYGNTLNIGDNELPSAVTSVPLPTNDPAVQITTGDNHTCALLQSGYVRCWGQNDYGQLGLGHIENVGDGEAITSLLGGIVNLGGIAVKVAAGGWHTCALMDTSGVRCWGRNIEGQLGYAHTNAVGDDEAVWSDGEVEVGGTVIDIAAGRSHTCALLDTGKVRCWGYNYYGQLGYGTNTTIGDNETPASAGDVDMGGDVTQIEAGHSHTCALLATGYMRCWGYGNYGQLGYGNGSSRWTPGGDLDTGATVTQMAVGGNHTCALLSTSQIKCWGYGVYGQLGYGGSGANAPPASGVNLDGNSPFQLTAGGNHTCALLGTGNAWCWGYNGYGQLGYGNTSSISSPPAGGDIQILAP